MNPTQTACNYALLRFMPYPQTGEVVNVGVVVNCLQPCFLHFLAEERMPDRVKALFPQQDEDVYQAALAAVKQDVDRINARIRDPKTCQIAFNELVRPRENTFRFGEVRTALTGDPQHFDEELFRRYVRMESDQAMVRAAARARAVAASTNTAIHIMRDGKIVEIFPAREVRYSASGGFQEEPELSVVREDTEKKRSSTTDGTDDHG